MNSRNAVFALGLAIASAAAAAEPKMVRFVPQADPGVLDPVVNSSYISMEHGYMVYDTLLAMDAHFTPQPEMLDRYAVSADGLTYSDPAGRHVFRMDEAERPRADNIMNRRGRDGFGVAFTHNEKCAAGDLCQRVDHRTPGLAEREREAVFACHQ